VPQAQSFTLPILALLLCLVLPLALSVGTVETDFSETVVILLSGIGIDISALLDKPPGAVEQAVLLNIRTPRVLMALLVGAALGTSGAAMQGMFRNPLADPGLIGISAGAALGAVTIIVLGTSLPVSQKILIPGAAFAGSIVTTIAVYRLATSAGRTSVHTLILAGIAIAAIASAGIGLLSFIADDTQLRTLVFWTMGSFGSATWDNLSIASLLMLLAIAIIPLYGSTLNAILLGESDATFMGYDVERTKLILVVLVALGVGAAVSVSGIIGFVGLVTPHLLRLMIGPDNRLLLPASALLGGICWWLQIFYRAPLSHRQNSQLALSLRCWAPRFSYGCCCASANCPGARSQPDAQIVRS
jgi:iron complex transport system permease protein